MNNYPQIYELEQLIDYCQRGSTLRRVSRGWVPARPRGYPSLGQRFSAAWLVFTGRADAVKWDEQ